MFAVFIAEREERAFYASLASASRGSIVLKSNIITRRAAPVMNETVERNILRCAMGFNVFAPETVNTVAINAADTPIIKSHLSRIDGEAFAAMFSDGTKSRRHPVSTSAKLRIENVKPVISTPFLACIFVYGCPAPDCKRAIAVNLDFHWEFFYYSIQYLRIYVNGGLSLLPFVLNKPIFPAQI